MCKSSCEKKNEWLTYFCRGSAEGVEDLVFFFRLPFLAEFSFCPFGAFMIYTLTSMNILAITYYNQGRRADALTIMADTAAILSRQFGNNHPNTIASVSFLTRWREEVEQSL
jgi:hypothetical protein